MKDFYAHKESSYIRRIDNKPEFENETIAVCNFEFPIYILYTRNGQFTGLFESIEDALEADE